MKMISYKFIRCLTTKGKSGKQSVSVFTRCKSSTTHTPPFWKQYDQSDEFQGIKQHVKKNHKPFKHLYVCGMPLTGALGIRNLVTPHKATTEPVEEQNTPHRLYFDKTSKLVDFDCGYGFSVFVRKLSHDNQVLGCGINTNSQLGFQRKRNQDEHVKDDDEGYAYIIEPSPIVLPFKHPRKTKVVKVSCGRAHTALLTDKEGVFTLGNNSFGQCGRQVVEGEMYLGSRKIHIIPHKYFSTPVIDVKCGMDHTLFLTKDGKVYSCGWSKDGQTGTGSIDNVHKPTLLQGDLEGQHITSITTFADTCLALSDSGEVFGWGSSEYYQLAAITEHTQVTSPTRLPFDRQGKIVQVSCGGTGCLLLNDDGVVYVWGYGILGKGPRLESSAWPRRIPSTLFGLSKHDLDIRVTSVASGLGHFMAITNRGELFSWGKNKSGCLGIQRSDDQYFPWKVILDSEAKKVKLGVDHTIIMSESIF